MKDSSHNIAFSYLYRDAGNNKQYNTVVFTNNANLSIDFIQDHIKAALIDGEWFYVDKWKLKDLHFDTWDSEFDHTWHEFDAVEETDELPTNGDISDFLDLISLHAKAY